MDVTALGLRNASTQQKEARQTLGQQDFLTLLVTQLRNQDPLNPLDNEAFVAQLAQFSTVSGITEMSATLGRLEALATGERRSSAPEWIGRDVSSEEGPAGRVASVKLADDGTVTLVLVDGSTLPLSSVASVA
jgi:flagellar hook assembly protein FlgD